LFLAVPLQSAACIFSINRGKGSRK
jgi:hypothetical protein